MTNDASETQSEREFLDRQVADAQAAIEQTLDDLRQSLKTAVDLRLWTRQHPWACVGMAAAAGFAAAHVAVASWQTAPESAPAQQPVAEPAHPSSAWPNRFTGFFFDLAKEGLATFARTAVQSSFGSQK